MPTPLQGVVTRLAGPDSANVLEGRDKYLAVTDFAGFGAVNNRLDDFFHTIVGDRNFDFRFWQEIDDVFGAAVEFGMSALPAESLDLADRHALHPDFTQGVPDVVQPKGFHNCCYKLHAFRSCSVLIEFTSGLLQKNGTAVDHNCLSGCQLAVITAQKQNRADDILRLQWFSDRLL